MATTHWACSKRGRCCSQQRCPPRRRGAPTTLVASPVGRPALATASFTRATKYIACKAPYLISRKPAEAWHAPTSDQPCNRMAGPAASRKPSFIQTPSAPIPCLANTMTSNVSSLSIPHCVSSFYFFTWLARWYADKFGNARPALPRRPPSKRQGHYREPVWNPRREKSNSGNGRLTRIRLERHKKQRDSDKQDAK